MKLIITIVVYITAAMAYDNIDDNRVATVYNDFDLFKKYYSCVVGVGECDDFGTNVKKDISEMLKDSCKECDYTQKHYTHAYLTKLKNELPDLYKKFEEMYDPTRTLLKKLDEEMLKYV